MAYIKAHLIWFGSLVTGKFLAWLDVRMGRDSTQDWFDYALMVAVIIALIRIFERDA